MVKRVLKEVDLTSSDKKPYAIKTTPVKVVKPKTDKQIAAAEKKKAKLVEKVVVPDKVEPVVEVVKVVEKVKKPPTEKQLAAREKLRVARIARLEEGKKAAANIEMLLAQQKALTEAVVVEPPVEAPPVPMVATVQPPPPPPPIAKVEPTKMPSIKEEEIDELPDIEMMRRPVDRNRYYNYPSGRNRAIITRMR